MPKSNEENNRTFNEQSARMGKFDHLENIPYSNKSNPNYTPQDKKGDTLGKNSHSNEGCFIATVCFGDYESDEVLILRDFRDNQLLRNKLGRLLVDFYYWGSPSLARHINRSNILKKFIRMRILKPIVKMINDNSNNL